jgi:hypothetical protein
MPVVASLLTVSSENDDGNMVFCVNPFPCTGQGLEVGARNELPAVITLPLPQPVKVYGFRFFCGNAVEDCEIAVSVVGDLSTF